MELSRQLSRHSSIILADLAATTLAWEYINQFWSAFANRVSRQSFLGHMKVLSDLSKKLIESEKPKDKKKDSSSAEAHVSTPKIKLYTNEELREVIGFGAPMVKLALSRVDELICSNRIDKEAFSDKLRKGLHALVSKIVDHQDLPSDFKSPYPDDIVRHTNVEERVKNCKTENFLN